MIADLKPYPNYKASGLPWLGQVPADWDVLPLAGVAHPKSVVGQRNRQLLSVYLRRGVVRFADVDEKRTNATSQDLGQYQAVDPGDFVLNNQQAWRGSVGVSTLSGIVSPAYLVLRLSNRYSLRYANLIFRDQSMVSQYLVCSKGVGTIQRNLYWPHLKRVGVLVPSLKEQAAIVRFLDSWNERLEQATRAKRKVIALLNEQKQAITHHAVTRGLDPSVARKPSGIPWLGGVPQQWEVLRSKYVFREVDIRSATGQETHLSMSQQFGLIPSSQIEVRRLVSDSYAGAKLCERGDLVLNRLKAHLGVFALAQERGVVSPDYTVLRPVREVDGRFFEAVYRTPACRVELRQRAKGIVEGFWRLYTDDFYDIRIPVPPVEEQKRIMAQLDIELSGVKAAISRLEREIGLLCEYRDRLVADVVTGKLDVRAAAAQLPEKVDWGAEGPLEEVPDAEDVNDEEEEAA